MYNKEDRAVANDRYRDIINQLLKLDREAEFEAQCIKAMAAYRNKLDKMACKMAELQTKVDLYEKYISYCTDHDSVELGEICEFHCVSSENDFKVGLNGGDKESNNAG